MKQTFYIKNMVCDRCKMVVNGIFQELNVNINAIQLGKVDAVTPLGFNEAQLKDSLQKNGFELIEHPELKTVEQIKTNLLARIDASQAEENLSDFLSELMHKDYSTLSKMFKKNEGQTIEKFFIKLKIEKTKELIQMNEYSFSEIAYQLGYNSISHLSGQFKTITGMTMSDYKNSQQWNRSSLDKIL